MKKQRLAIFIYCAVAGLSAVCGQASAQVVRFQTILGNIDVELTPAAAPETVANFLGYVDRGDYDNTFFHRSVPGFVIQGGGYIVSNGDIVSIPKQAAVANEFNVSNLRGTISMAKLKNDPNSATDEWFFNLADNSANLDSQNGGFTVFGHVTNGDGLAVMDAIAALQIVNLGSPYDALPVVNYSDGQATVSNLVLVPSISRLPAHPAFFNGEVPLSHGVFYLQLPDGTPFGYYSYLSDPNYIYHFDLGYEYLFDAKDDAGGIYFYDFTANTFFYTSPSFAFPYLYDFTLKTVLYYFSGTSNPRYFANLATGAIITR